MIYTDRWAFQHIPKTSGSNFKIHLKEKCAVSHPTLPDSRDVWIHQPISYWVDSGIIPEGYQWITIVRNPYSRLVSFYHYLKQRNGDSHDIDPQSFTFQCIFHPFEEFIKKDIIDYDGGEWWTRFIKDGGLWRNWWTQSKFLEGDHKVRIFHIENLEELEDFVHVKFAHTRYNTSSHYANIEDHYTKETRDIVYERYREDFENFGYRR